MNFDKKINAVLAEYHARIASEAILMQALTLAEGMKSRDEFLLSVGEETAVFLNTLVKSAKSKCVLEIGTSFGYSTIWLAEAVRATGGKVISLENMPEKAKFAQSQIDKAGLTDFVEIRIGDALESIRNAKESFDFVLVDIWKELYVPCFELFYPKLNEGAYVIGDNMILPPHSQNEANLYRAKIKESNAFDSVLMPIGSGIEVSRLVVVASNSPIFNNQMRPHHVGISIANMQKSIAWYIENLGFEIVSENDFPNIKTKIAFLRKGEFQIELFEHYESQKIEEYRKMPLTDMQHQGTLHICFYIQTDIEKLYNKLVENDVEVAMSLRLSPPGDAKMCFIRDNTGNLIELIQFL
jgi:predicted O-methyltransferase YrrM/catechol 2,3-dioxygenase-like lactoylglutathione lyase family enzyme